MRLDRLYCAVDNLHLPSPVKTNGLSAHPISKPSTGRLRGLHTAPNLRRVKPGRRSKSRRLRCDCGRLAITVLSVRVGSDPQYTIRLPLCPACLKLEQELHR